MTATTTSLAEGVPQTLLARTWWALALRAVAAVLFAFLAFFWLGKAAMAALAFLFAAYAVADGIFSLVGAIRGGGIASRPWLSLAGAVSIAAGIAAALWPGLTSTDLAMIMGGWAVVRGGLEFVSALALRRVLHNEWSLALVGMASILFGAMLVLNPDFDAWTLVRLVSAYALILGVLLILLALHLRKPQRP